MRHLVLVLAFVFLTGCAIGRVEDDKLWGLVFGSATMSNCPPLPSETPPTTVTVQTELKMCQRMAGAEIREEHSSLLGTLLGAIFKGIGAVFGLFG